MKKIGLVIPSTPNYSETFFINKIKGLQANGIDVVLFVGETRKGFSLCNVRKRPKVYRNKLLFLVQFLYVILSLIPHLKTVLRFVKFEKASGKSNSEILKYVFLNSHILKSKLDWLHFGFATQAIGSELVAKAIGARMAVSFRGFDINVFPKKQKDCYLKLWKNVDKVHSISQYLVGEAYLLGLGKNVPISIIAPAIDISFINKIKTNNKSKTNNNFTICTVARLNWIKDITTAIKTIGLLKAQFPDIRYNIVGGGTLQEKERYLFLVQQLDLQKNVVFYDKLDHSETLKKIAECDIYLQTSLNEGFCNAVLEAQALGKLCIATNVGALNENIEDTKTGWLVESQNPVAISNKILEINDLSEVEKEKVKKQAINRAEINFNSEKQIESFVKFYKNI